MVCSQLRLVATASSGDALRFFFFAAPESGGGSTTTLATSPVATRAGSRRSRFACSGLKFTS